jgi:intracellular sulfur oxidation DsrE/DsrF family protein
MNRNVTRILLICLAMAGGPAMATSASPNAQAAVAAATSESAASAPGKLGCAAPAEYASTATTEAQGTQCAQESRAVAAGVPRVVFQLNKAEDAPTILRFVTNYLAVEPTAQVAVVGYAGGIDFMLKDARDPTGKPYADQLAALTERGVAFKVCNNTLKARNLTSAAVSPPATVVPGAVNEIIRLQTREGYAYFQN